jgi:pectinesterase
MTLLLCTMPAAGLTAGHNAQDSIVVKTVGKGYPCDYHTIQAAFTDVPDNFQGQWIIRVKPGIYHEKCLLAATKKHVYLLGQNADSCIISYDTYAGQDNGNGGTWGTGNSFSVSIDADDFYASGITFRNTRKNDGTTGSKGEQAVALRTRGDRQQYRNCRLLGYQDTYYTNSAGRIYMKNCYIEGSVDFIFGNGTVLFDSCHLFANRNGGVICAPNTGATSAFGYVFRHCLLSSLPQGASDFRGNAMQTFYLGRPWHNKPRAVYLNCEEPATLAPAGWTKMSEGLAPLFAEYRCYGPGAGFSGRSRNEDYQGIQLTPEEASAYTPENIFSTKTNPVFENDWIPIIFVEK